MEFKSDIEMVENEDFSPNHSNQNKENDANGGVNIKPEGRSESDFEKFARGADYATLSGLENGAPLKRKPGRPPNTAKKNSLNVSNPQASSADQNLSNSKKPPEPIKLAAKTSGIIFGLGKIPAARAGDSRWALTNDESKQIAESLDEVFTHLAPSLSQMDPKTAAIFGFVATVGMIYYSKYEDINSKPAAKPEQDATAAPAAVETAAPPSTSVESNDFNPLKLNGRLG